MRPSMFLGGGGRAPATFVGASLQNQGSGTPTFSPNFAAIPGLSVGDYLLIFVQGTGTNEYGGISPSVGWSQDNYVWTTYGYRESVFHRRLTTLTPPTISGFGSPVILIAAYRGPTRAARRVIRDQPTPAGLLTAPGVSRVADGMGLLSAIFDRHISTGPIAPSGDWTKRLEGVSTFFRAGLADALPREDYADGASMTWSGLGTTFSAVAQTYELLA